MHAKVALKGGRNMLQEVVLLCLKDRAVLKLFITVAFPFGVKQMNEAYQLWGRSLERQMGF